MSVSVTDTEEKTQTSARPVAKRFRGRLPFQSCFILRQELGRSYILPSQLNKQEVPTITPKFYSRFDTGREGAEETEEDRKELMNRVPRPKDRYDYPVTENHRYGWYTDPLVEIDRADRRLHHAKCSSEMIKMQFLINCSKTVEKK